MKGAEEVKCTAEEQEEAVADGHGGTVRNSSKLNLIWFSTNNFCYVSLLLRRSISLLCHVCLMLSDMEYCLDFMDNQNLTKRQMASNAEQ